MIIRIQDLLDNGADFACVGIRRFRDLHGESWNVNLTPENVLLLSRRSPQFVAFLRKHKIIPLLDLSRKDLREVDFSKIDEQFYPNLSGAIFDGSNLDGVDLSGMQLRRASFVGCSMMRTKFANANIRAANFDGATMNEAVLTGSIISDDTIFPVGYKRMDG
jgi:uncharacterized protein YjbI with pentapeptide repeats